MKSDLEEGEKLLVERQKHILLADKSEYGWSTVEECKQHDLADDSEDGKRIYSAERRARAVNFIPKEEEVFSNGCDQKFFTAQRAGFVSKFPIPNSAPPASHCQFWFPAASPYHWHMLRLWKDRPLACLLPRDDKAVPLSNFKVTR